MMQNQMPISNEQGVSLISLMVGLLISMLAVLGSFSLYKNLISTSVGASFDASHDGQISLALQRIQLETQGAGYGLLAQNNPHLIVDAGGDVIFRYEDTLGLRCLKLSEVIGTDGVTGRPSSELFFYQATAGCNGASTLNSLTLTWPSEADAESLAYFIDYDQVIAGATVKRFSFNAGVGDCIPYGFGKQETRDVLEVFTYRSAAWHTMRAGGADLPLKFDFCLANSYDSTVSSSSAPAL